MKSLLKCTTLCLTLAASLLGCMKRKETIKVAPDGSVTMRLQYEADSLEELEEGDAIPSAEAGWKVKRDVKIEEDGDEEHEFTAEKVFPPGAGLPCHYADPGDPDADLCLQFPTRLTIEQRSDGTYYHFYRVYPTRRNWARLNRIAEKKLEGPDEQLGDKEKWTQDDWLVALEALVKFELVKMTTFARSAFLEAFPDGAQDGWLNVRTALHGVTEELDGDRVAALLAESDDEACERELEAEAEAFEASAMARMTSALAGSGYEPRRIAEYENRYQWHKRHYEISEDLGDESFKIKVQMPGEIVAANADSIDENQAKWEFKAEDIRDSGLRGLELMVTSRVAR